MADHGFESNGGGWVGGGGGVGGKGVGGGERGS